MMEKIEKEFLRVSGLYYAERNKQANGEENEVDFYEGYREGLSFAIMEIRKESEKSIKPLGSTPPTQNPRSSRRL
ncbi:hypothetical protein LptCag_1478 [Leptospirillum ferriphilum]|uniref:Uncharacterized protein n=1 Tax=Leptospirillum ferriphilum TaxID=178606 RepID=A0A094W8B6_9BACT|nr:hypothetical protein [Leptospirillum ferriphilum]KGA93768.1 hypothetical protein LptCag_1478 [Leptospirillum ferriphilum]